MPGRFEDRLRGLRRLPVLEPPAQLEASTLEAMAKASPARRARLLALAAAVIAAIGGGVLLAMLVPSSQPSDDAEARSAAVAAEAVYGELLERSAYLEQVLAELPQRQVMRVSTAGTIVGLEERIALIDTALAQQDGEEIPPEYRLALMRDRVDTMSALVSVRYAQSKAFSY